MLRSAFIFLVLAALPAWGAPLSDGAVIAAKRIAIFPGTFDFFHRTHAQLAEAALREAGIDLVVILPNQENIKKAPVAADTRLSMIDLALRDHSQIVYPSGGVWSAEYQRTTLFKDPVIEHIRALNPTAEISLLMGSDVGAQMPAMLYMILKHKPARLLVRGRVDVEAGSIRAFGLPVKRLMPAFSGRSASRLREYLAKNDWLYLLPKGALERERAKVELATYAFPDVLDFIWDNGLYLDRTPGKNVSWLGWGRELLAGNMVHALSAMGLFQSYKQWKVAHLPDAELPRITFNGEPVPILKKLGGGITATAYLIVANGEQRVLKVARNERGRTLLRSSVRVQSWMHVQSPSLVPSVHAFHESGDWMISSYCEGPTLQEVMASPSGVTPGLRSELLAMYGQIQALEQRSQMRFDFAPDNIVVTPQGLRLVDLGTLSATQYQSRAFVTDSCEDQLAKPSRGRIETTF